MILSDVILPFTPEAPNCSITAIMQNELKLNSNKKSLFLTTCQLKLDLRYYEIILRW